MLSVMLFTLRRYALLALSFVGSATLLFSCSEAKPKPEYDFEALMTERSENRTIVMVENGKRSYSFSAPIIEGYSLAKNPYQEFRKGIKMITYTNDSLSLHDAQITANYAIYYDKQKLWEAKGNVVIIKKNRKEGDTTVTGLTEVYTQQLFWDARTKKIFSNVDTKILQPDGWHSGVGFEADEDLKNTHFRKYKSEMEFDFSPVEQSSDEKSDADNADKSDKAKKSDRPRPGGRPTPRDSKHSLGSPSIMPSSVRPEDKPVRPTQRPTNASQKKPTQRPTVDAISSMSSSLESGVNSGVKSSSPRGALKPPTSQGSPKREGGVSANGTSAPKCGSTSAKRDAETTKR
jgi:LPS export ABC transporter protein LptC